MELAEEFKEGLKESFDWEYINIPNLDEPVLIIFNYSPSSKSRPLSLAFSLKGNAKCWISHDKVKEIGGKSPNRHQEYRDFDCKGQRFYAFSVQPFQNPTFTDIAEFKKACKRLHAHIDQEADR